MDIGTNAGQNVSVKKVQQFKFTIIINKPIDFSTQFQHLDLFLKSKFHISGNEMALTAFLSYSRFHPFTILF